MSLGVCLALAANALWALAFLAPYVSGALHGADFVFLRFSFYGGLAAVLILQMQREGAELHFRHAIKAMTLGAVGYAFSFLCTYFAVELAGGVLAALLIGLVPVVFSIGANLHEKALPWPPLLIAAGAILLGLVVLQADNLRSLAATEGGWRTWLGTLCGLGAMLSWGFFVLNNKAGNVTGLSPSQENRLWVAWIGVGSFLGSAIILLPFLATGQSQIPNLFAVAQHDWRPIALAAFMSLFSTWAATWLWREGVRHLTPALTAQLAASETLFAVAYALFYERTVPSVGVATGAVLIMGGIMLTSAIPFMVGRLRSRRAVPTDD